MGKKNGGVDTVTIEAGGKSVTMSAENFHRAAAGGDVPEKGALDGVLRPVVANALGKDRTEISTAERIADASVLRLRIQRAHGGLRLLSKRLQHVAGTLEEHEESAASARIIGQQTMLFGDVDEATLAPESEMIEAVESAVAQALEASAGFGPDE